MSIAATAEQDLINRMRTIRKIIKDSKNIILLLFVFFILGIGTGFSYFEETKEKITPILEHIKEQILGKSKFQIALNIFSNNLIASLLILVSGTFIIAPFFIIFTNGFLVGFIIKLLLEKNLGLIFFIKGVAPHSIFELPAVFISASIGIRIGHSYLTWDKKKRMERVSQRIREAAAIYLLIVIPLLLIAAFVEAFVSLELIM